MADLSEHVGVIAELIALDEGIASWGRAFAKSNSDLPQPPKISERLASILKSSGDNTRIAFTDLAQSIFDRASQLQELPPPTMQIPPQVLSDPRLLLGVVALDFAKKAGVALDSRDLAFLAVVSGEEAPAKDRAEYDRVLDNWRKKLETIRILQSQLRS